MKTKSHIRSAVIEVLEQRRLLTFTPAGAPVMVDPPTTTVTGVQATAGLSDGRHVVTYKVGADLFARLYNADGTPVTAAQQVNTAGVATSPDVAITSNGSFIVTWQQDDSDQAGVQARQFAGTGVATGVPFNVNTTETGTQIDPRVGIDGSGNFTIIWTSDDGTGPRVIGQRYNSASAAQGAETLISANEDSTTPDYAMTASGVSVAVWNNAANTLAARFDASLNQLGTDITVDNETATQPAIGIATDGSFVVAWSVAAGGGTKDVVFRRYNSAGASVGAQTNAPSDTAGDEQFPQIDVAGTGKFIISWAEASITPGTFDQIGLRGFTSSGTSLGDDAVISGVNFSTDTRHGVIWRDTTTARVAYLNGADAEIQEFDSQLVINLPDTTNVLQVFGSPSNLRVIENGVTTNYATDLFTNTTIAINGGAAADYIRVKSTTQNVSVIGGSGDDTIITAEGNDYVEGGLGNDAINLGDGDDYAIGNDEQDTLYGGNGNDTLTGGPGRNLMYGENGDDLLGGGNRPDTMFGGNGNDRMLGRQGGDALIGEDGDDTLDGGTGNDGILGDNGNDSLIGGAGNDTLTGGRGDDTLRGGGDIDRLYPQAGFDLIDGGPEGDYGYPDPLDIVISIEIRRNVP